MNSSASTRMDRYAWLILAAALALLLGSVAQLAYRFTLPTDGWSVLTEEIVESNWLYYSNLVGAESALQPDDVILAVDGVSVQGTATTGYVPAPARWQVGQTVEMRVWRGEEQIAVAVPVVNWTVKAAANYFSFAVRLGSQVGALLLLAVGWFTFLRRPDVPSARALLVYCTALGATFISGILPDGLSVQFNQPAFLFTIFYSYMIFGSVIAPSLLTFSLLFPRPKQVIQRRPWLALLPFAFGVLLLLFFAAGGSGEVGWFSTLAMLALVIVSLVHSGLTQRDAVSQAQLRWAISAFVLGLGLFMLNFPLAFNWITNPILVTPLLIAQSLGSVVIGTGLAVAVLRYRLFDIDVIIRKTLIYALLSVLLALLYFGSVVLLQSLVGRATDEQSPLIIVLSTLLIAALFAPLRRRVQNVIDRRFFRKKYDAQQVLAHFAQTVQNEVELDTLTAELGRVVRETMQPEQVTFWFHDPYASGKRP